MSRRSEIAAALAISILAASVTACPARDPPEPSPTPQDATPTEQPSMSLPEAPVERRIAPGGCDLYVVSMQAGQVLRLEVQQEGIDVATTVTSEDGSDRLELDSPVQDHGPDGGAYVGIRPGVRRIEVCAEGAGGRSGLYRIRREPLRPAAETDRVEDAAYRAYAEGRTFRDEGRLADARAAYERALAGFRRAGVARPQGWALYKLARVAQDEGDLEAAEASYRASAALHLDLSDHRQVAVVLSWLGSLLDHDGRSRSALEAYEEATGAALAAHAHELAGARFVERATIHGNLGDTVEALALYRQAISELRRAGDPVKECDAYRGIGLLYRFGGQPERAVGSYTQALHAARQAHDRKAEATALVWLAGAHLDLEQARQALRYLNQAVSLLDPESGGAEWVEAQDALGRAYRQLGRYDEAAAAFSEALHREPSPLWEATIRINLARLHAERGEHRPAVEECRRTLPLTRSLGRRSLIASAEACIADNLMASGRSDEALTEIREAVAQVERVRQGFAPDELRSTFFSGRHQYFELYVRVLLDLYRLDLDPGYLEEAFEVSERSKARTLLDGLERAEPRVERTAPAQLLEQKDELERQVSKLETELLRTGGDLPPSAALHLSQLKADLAAARGAILASHPGWRSALAVEPANLETIREQLLSDGDTQIVSYFLGKDWSVVWVVGRDTLEVRELPARRDIEELATATADRLAQSHEPHQQLQSELYVEHLSRMILQPIADTLHARRLLLLKEGALHAVPFGALSIDEPAKGKRYLADRFELVEAPSASTALALGRARSNRPQPSRLLAILADPVFQRDDSRFRQVAKREAPAEGSPALSRRMDLATDLRTLPRLPASGEEAEAIAGLVRSEDRMVALGFEATRDLVLSGRLRSYRMIHIATHGVATAPVSGLVFARWDPSGKPVESLVSEWEIYDLQLSADLVVLSACRSGLGQRLPGEGVLGLARAFLWAGASRVVVSLWDVDDQATARLMSEFYRELLEGGSTPGEALRRAQRVVRSHPGWAAPHYWAGFVLQGDLR
jgi:CHAT domain-containing protein